MRLFIATLILAATMWGQGAGGVQFRDWNAPGGTVSAKTVCGELRNLTDYELSVIGASLIPAAGDVPEHCRVSVLIAPQINIEVNLPTAWNGRLYMFGNGGFAGESFNAPNRVANRGRALQHGFATAATDTGHSAATEPGASFAVNEQKLVDFGFRSLHLTAETAKRLVRAYYSQAPTKAYFDGCSQGGRQALIFAQRFPADFDGILAGAPALDNTGTMLARAWWMQGLANNPIPASKLKLVSDAVYEKCDAKDGLKDGLIDDPRRCGFEVARDLPKCAAGLDKPDCFTPAEIASLERVHSDVVSQGKRLFPGWLFGAEIAGPNGQSGWIGQAVNGPNGSTWTRYAETFLQFMAFPEKDPYPLSRFDIDRDPARIGALGQIMNATDADLSAFERHGGKLIMYFGWADPQLNPMMGVEYYEKVAERMGSKTADFFRLFMVPGMFHCGGGVGTSTFDADTPLVRWVESGSAPEQIAASRIVDNKVVRTRPLCVYPQVARYKGSGSIDEAANFSCVKP
ncbi:MAG TPA: tannase/feruloyl esterase family alpha/beta hydrolase [Bryobacteraceae bacterium]|nr:tannase/feruloyl esterase family alpha/beta hydrolase [Bryobacteraceae bacterium]HUI82084.1 tannase/feruloyl esterase family alpha/beta hydrolase [Bryobacteraceae bacterium]